MILQALELTAERNVRDFARITVLFNPDEEIGSRGSADLIARQAHQILALQTLSDSAKSTTVDWTRIRPGESPNVIPIRGSLPVSLNLAGGLDAPNLGQAIEQVQPFGVDVKCGVKGSDGFKDPDLVVAEKTIAHDDQRRCNGAEGKFGQGKHRFGFGLVREKLAETSDCTIAMNLLVMNLETNLLEHLVVLIAIFHGLKMACIASERRPTLLISTGLNIATC